ncbi:MAG: DNRLRE domain-containing protein [Deltaproteobacteria bacterium]|jgi:hypothetical protein|nr:DNRLRE domain-containing protein [Deltaproteobacteria bacterium]MBW2536437.1 DNRLRE domain-containing protein [Deltaproteobacteria bacterium]
MAALLDRTPLLISMVAAFVAIPASCHLAVGLDDYSRSETTAAGTAPGGSGGVGGGAAGSGGVAGTAAGGYGAAGGDQGGHGGACQLDSYEPEILADSWMASGSPTQNYGSNPTFTIALLPADGGPEPLRGHAALHFDLTQPPGATRCVAAEVCVTQTGNVVAGGLSLEARPLEQPWVEAQVSWTYASNGAAWGVPGGAGGELVSVLTFSVVPGSADQRCWDVTSYVQAVWDGELDYGLLLKPAANSNQAQIVLHAREADAGPGPKLTVSYCR